jgi:hypothetical protein
MVPEVGPTQPTTDRERKAKANGGGNLPQAVKRELGIRMAAEPKAKGGGDRKSDEYHRVTEKPGDPSANVTLDEAGLDKNLTHRARNPGD